MQIQPFINFVINHWFLWALFVAILAMIVVMELRTQVGGVNKINSQQLVNLINHDHAVVLDVRDDSVYQEGHIVGSINIPSAELADKKKKLNKYKNKPLVIVCNNGQSSIKTGIELRKEGIEKIYSLNGGITAWRNDSMPVAKGK